MYKDFGEKVVFRVFSILFSLAFAIVGLCPSILNAQTVQSYYFDRDLSFGVSDIAVKMLQIFLNVDPETRVAITGVGSPGNESVFFGSLTRDAVMRFQLKYKNEILVPAGLTFPTGFVGPGTRKKLNSFLQTGVQNVSVNTSEQVSMPVISAVSKISLSPGETLKITGNFSGKSIVHIDDDVVPISKITGQTDLEIIVPNKNGIGMVWVSNEYGDSRADFPFFIAVGGNISAKDLEIISNQNLILHNKAIDPANQ